jgi:hypothetical protein
MTLMMEDGAVTTRRVCGRHDNGESSEKNKRQQNLLQSNISNCG